MNRHMRLRVSLLMSIGMAAVSAVSVYASADEPLRPARVALAAGDEDHTCFVVTLSRPENLGGDFQALTLESVPPHRYRGFLEFSPSNPRLREELIFICRGPRTGQVDLWIRYEASDGIRTQRAVRIDLSDAATLDDEEPVQRWAEAQARHFEWLAEETDDLGGFFSYAGAQTRRKYGLGERELAERRDRVPLIDEFELFETMSGARAMQETMQLDRMLMTEREAQKPTVRLDEVQPLETPSIDYAARLGDAKPRMSRLARLTPEDFCYSHANGVQPFLRLLQELEFWGGPVWEMVTPLADETDPLEFTMRQLTLTADTLKQLTPEVVSEMAVIGSDPYLDFGTDVSLLMRVADRAAFENIVDPAFRGPEGARVSVELTPDVTATGWITPGRELSVLRAWLDDVCVYSNSPAALRRIAALHGSDEGSLAQEPGFRFHRVEAYPLDRGSGAVYVYMSDPYLRRVVGPATRIKQHRRMMALTSLRALTNGALLHAFEDGPQDVITVDRLVETGHLARDYLYSAERDDVSWSGVRDRAVSARYGELQWMTPLLEVEITSVTPRERDAYDNFRRSYQQYWRRNFDPIAIEITPGHPLRASVHIEPLIESSDYVRLRQQFDEETTSFSVPPTPTTVVQYGMTIGRSNQLRTLATMMTANTPVAGILDWMGDSLNVLLIDDAFLATFAADLLKEDPQPSNWVLEHNVPVAVGLKIRNPVTLSTWLAAVRSRIEEVAGDLVGFHNAQPYKGVTITQIAPRNRGTFFGGPHSADSDEGEVQGVGEAAVNPNSGLDERPPAIYRAVIGDRLYASLSPDALRKLIDMKPGTRTRPTGEQDSHAAQTSSDQSKPVPPARTVDAHALVYLAPGAVQEAREQVQSSLTQAVHAFAAKHAADDLVYLQLLADCGVLERTDQIEAVGKRYLGSVPRSPAGGVYYVQPETAGPPMVGHNPPLRAETVSSSREQRVMRLFDALESVLAYVIVDDDSLRAEIEILRR